MVHNFLLKGILSGFSQKVYSFRAFIYFGSKTFSRLRYGDTFFRKTFKSHLRCTPTLCIICVYKSGDFPGKTPLVSSLAYYTYVCIMAKHLCVCVYYAPNQTIKIIIHQLFSEELYTHTHTHFEWCISSLVSLSLTLSLSF